MSRRQECQRRQPCDRPAIARLVAVLAFRSLLVIEPAVVPLLLGEVRERAFDCIIELRRNRTIAPGRNGKQENQQSKH